MSVSFFSLVKAAQDRKHSFSTFENLCQKMKASLSYNQPQKQQSYCGLRKKQTILRQQDKLPQTKHKDNFPRTLTIKRTRQNKAKASQILQVSPAVIYSTLRPKKQSKRGSTLDAKLAEMRRERAITEGEELSPSASLYMKLFKRPKKRQNDERTGSENDMVRRPWTAEVGSNRLRTLHDELSSTKVRQIEEKLKGWETAHGDDDF